VKAALLFTKALVLAKRAERATMSFMVMYLDMFIGIKWIVKDLCHLIMQDKRLLTALCNHWKVQVRAVMNGFT